MNTERRTSDRKNLRHEFPDGVIMPKSTLGVLTNQGRYGAVAPGDFSQAQALSAPFHDALDEVGALARESMLPDVVEAAESAREGSPHIDRGEAIRNGPWDWYYDLIRLDGRKRNIAQKITFRGPDTDWLTRNLDQKGFPAWADSVIDRHRQDLSGVILSDRTDGDTRTVEMSVPGTFVRMWPRDEIFHPDIDSGVRRTPVLRFIRGKWSNGIPFLDLFKIGRSRLPREFSDLQIEEIGISPSWENLTPEQQLQQTRMGPHVNDYDQVYAQVSTRLPPHVLADLDSDALQKGLYDSATPQSIRMSEHGLLIPAVPGSWEGNQYQLAGLGPPWENGPWSRLWAWLTGTMAPVRHPYHELFYWLPKEETERLQNAIRFGPAFGIRPPLESFAEGTRVIRKSRRYGIQKHDKTTERAVEYFHNPENKSRIRKAMADDPSHHMIPESWANLVASSYFRPRETIETADWLGLLSVLPHATLLRSMAADLPHQEEVLRMIRNNSAMTSLPYLYDPYVMLNKRLRSLPLIGRHIRPYARAVPEEAREGDGWKLISRLRPAKRRLDLPNLEVVLRLFAPQYEEV